MVQRSTGVRETPRLCGPVIEGGGAGARKLEVIFLCDVK